MNTAYRGVVLLNEPLASYTTWRVGGFASVLYKPVDVSDLACFLKSLPASEPVLFLGLGSNSLIRDTGFAGTVILTQGCLKGIAQEDALTVRVEAGVSCATMARFCARLGLVGGEFWAGIPGTMGGALRMNAGCFGRETWQFVKEIETIDRKGTRHIRTPDDFSVAYRHVEGLLPDEWFVSALCELTQGEKETSLTIIKDLLAHRAKTQPTNEYNCGSVFRNPPADFAARLIESCGLKGRQIGGAMVSAKHANFIINQDGLASAADIESLIGLIKQTVADKTQIELIREVHIIGEEHAKTT